MGYRLHARIPNVKPYDEVLELGRQYDYKWYDFNNKWFGKGNDSGRISHEDIKEFFEEYVEINNQPSAYDLYNTEHLKEMVDYALLHKVYIYFESF